ncbi:MAG TPA: hypothetical protein PKY30_22310, partial [Myxococcota bacterium]|nr:hypothetical protein [Myxococcota bacterium]
YGSFVVTGNLLDEWYQHEIASDHDARSAPRGGRWYITEMAEPIVGDAATHTESEETKIEGYIPLLLTHDMAVSFY